MKKAIVIDFSNFIEADDGNTTHYGGTIDVDGVEFTCNCNDRSSGSNQEDAIMYALESMFGKVCWTIYGEIICHHGNGTMTITQEDDKLVLETESSIVKVDQQTGDVVEEITKKKECKYYGIATDSPIGAGTICEVVDYKWEDDRWWMQIEEDWYESYSIFYIKDDNIKYVDEYKIPKLKEEEA